mmetsp:Transcript_3866/g.7554  ORF Transcript_3866/g.7554 Transcript_3866/m.7554 type:complete len:325 (+) Transcript_3866:111-1085(+)
MKSSALLLSSAAPIAFLVLSALAAPTSAFLSRSVSTSTPDNGSGTCLNAASGYKLGAKTTGILLNNRFVVESLGSVLPDGVEMSEIALLRFALAHPERRDAEGALKSAVRWRQGKGKEIVDAAAEAVAKATEGGGWDNDVVRNAAPHGDIINKYITPQSVITMSTDEGDLVYVIRASQIDDKELMDRATVEQVCDYFLYAKEIHNLVANSRSESTGRMCSVIFANDISGVRKAPDRRFSQALTSSSDQYESLYPSLAGPTMILNLPFVLQAFVGLLKPLFPKSVQERLVFKRAPVLAGLKELTPLATDARTKTSFVKEVKKLLP